jgi:hypothetical protein
MNMDGLLRKSAAAEEFWACATPPRRDQPARKPKVLLRLRDGS